MSNEEKINLISTLNFLGYNAKTFDGNRLFVEGSTNGINWVIEEDFDVFWLCEEGEKDTYYQVDAFCDFDKALDTAKRLS